MKNYKVVNGLSFAEGTNDQVCNILSNLSRSTRIRVWYGDQVTGKSWNEENNVVGYVGRSTGTVKIPLLINNARSYGGPELFSDSIIKIVDTQTHRVLYQHPAFNQSTFTNNGPDEKYNFVNSFDWAPEYMKHDLAHHGANVPAEFVK